MGRPACTTLIKNAPSKSITTPKAIRYGDDRGGTHMHVYYQGEYRLFLKLKALFIY